MAETEAPSCSSYLGTVAVLVHVLVVVVVFFFKFIFHLLSMCSFIVILQHVLQKLS